MCLRVPKSRPEELGSTGHRPGRPASLDSEYMIRHVGWVRGVSYVRRASSVTALIGKL